MAHHVWTFVNGYPECASFLVNGHLVAIGRYEIGMQRRAVVTRRGSGPARGGQLCSIPGSPSAESRRIPLLEDRNSSGKDFLRRPVCLSMLGVWGEKRRNPTPIRPPYRAERLSPAGARFDPSVRLGGTWIHPNDKGRPTLRTAGPDVLSLSWSG
jgi:hypothetical protein